MPRFSDVVVVEAAAEVGSATLVDEGRHRTQDVPRALVHRVLDADHVRAEGRQPLRRARTGELTGEVADANALERPRRRHPGTISHCGIRSSSPVVGSVTASNTTRTAIADAHRVGRGPGHVARHQDPRRISNRDQHDRVGHLVGERRVHGVVDDHDALDAPVSGAREARPSSKLWQASQTSSGGCWMCAQARHCWNVSTPAVKKARFEVIERRQRPLLAEDALHSGAPNSTALPGA